VGAFLTSVAGLDAGGRGAMGGEPGSNDFTLVGPGGRKDFRAKTMARAQRYGGRGGSGCVRGGGVWDKFRAEAEGEGRGS